jgi:hypothetical protein
MSKLRVACLIRIYNISLVLPKFIASELKEALGDDQEQAKKCLAKMKPRIGLALRRRVKCDSIK